MVPLGSGVPKGVLPNQPGALCKCMPGAWQGEGIPSERVKTPNATAECTLASYKVTTRVQRRGRYNEELRRGARLGHVVVH